MKDIPASILTLIAGVVVALVSLWAGQNLDLLPEQVSEQAPLVDNLFNVMITIATALFLVVEGAIVIFVIKYRRREGDDSDGNPLKGNIPLEILWTAIPAVIVIGLGFYSVEVYAEMGGFTPTGAPMMAHHHTPASQPRSGSAIAAPLDAPQPQGTEIAAVEQVYGIINTPDSKIEPDVVVNVTGVQYAWLFNYPDSGIVTGELHIPVGADVKLNLSAQDVLHSFWLPQFRLKQDALPGQKSELRFVAAKTGTYPVVCAELCGAYHGSMRTQVIVHTPEEYAAWVTENQVAQQMDPNHAIATNPADLSEAEFLAPYAHDMGVDAAVLAQMQP